MHPKKAKAKKRACLSVGSVAAKTNPKSNSRSDIFHPPWLLRSTLLQTVLASRKIRTRGADGVRRLAREVVLNLDDGVRLQGFYSPNAMSRRCGTAVVIHGWEGSAESAYVLCVARHLLANGFGVFRLNMRDHGNTHHLNQGLFYATRLKETHQAVQQVAALAAPDPVYLVGFSMGGNFALRIGLLHERDPVPGFRHIAAISPVLNPDRSTTAVDRFPLIRWYFRKKWKRSLETKQALFPAAYDFRRALAQKTIRRMSEILIGQYSEFATLEDYFAAYTLSSGALSKLALPTTIITAQDDPIVPIEDFRGLKLKASTRLIVHRFGGHSGFIEDVTLTAWHERRLPDLLYNSDQGGSTADPEGVRAC
jgi:predicted alpha/beta-fold hydrolase